MKQSGRYCRPTLIPTAKSCLSSRLPPIWSWISFSPRLMSWYRYIHRQGSFLHESVRCFLTAGNHSVLLFRITAITISLEFQSLSESLNTDREILIPYIFYFENPCSIWLYLRYLFLLVIITNETISDGFTVRCS